MSISRLECWLLEEILGTLFDLEVGLLEIVSKLDGTAVGLLNMLGATIILDVGLLETEGSRMGAKLCLFKVVGLY